MIYLTGIESLIECAYLDETLGDNLKDSKIFVNPTSITYLTGKTVIVSNLSYPIKAIELLLNHGNRVISRVALDNLPKGVILNPYILRPTWSLMWNGEIIKKKIQDIEELSENCSFSYSDSICYFPKIESPLFPLMDSKDHLTSLGWALHQAGQNIDQSSVFLDLDLLKTKKLQI